MFFNYIKQILLKLTLSFTLKKYGYKKIKNNNVILIKFLLDSVVLYSCVSIFIKHF